MLYEFVSPRKGAEPRKFVVELTATITAECKIAPRSAKGMIQYVRSGKVRRCLFQRIGDLRVVCVDFLDARLASRCSVG